MLNIFEKVLMNQIHLMIQYDDYDYWLMIYIDDSNRMMMMVDDKMIENVVAEAVEVAVVLVKVVSFYSFLRDSLRKTLKKIRIGMKTSKIRKPK